MASADGRKTVGSEKLAHSNILTLNALVELLAEKGLFSKQAVLERVKQLQAQTQLRKEPQYLWQTWVPIGCLWPCPKTLLRNPP